MRSRKATARRAAARSRSPIFSPSSSMPASRNTVWITADMHYTAAHYYDPNAAVFQDFEPFWEFISGPIHAGTWRPQTARQHLRSARGVPEGLRRRSARRPRALLRAAVLRPRGDRRRDRGDDRDAQGRRGPGPLVDQDRAAHGEMVARLPAGRSARSSGLSRRADLAAAAPGDGDHRRPRRHVGLEVRPARRGILEARRARRTPSTSARRRRDAGRRRTASRRRA